MAAVERRILLESSAPADNATLRTAYVNKSGYGCNDFSSPTRQRGRYLTHALPGLRRGLSPHPLEQKRINSAAKSDAPVNFDNRDLVVKLLP